MSGWLEKGVWVEMGMGKVRGVFIEEERLFGYECYRIGHYSNSKHLMTEPRDFRRVYCILHASSLGRSKFYRCMRASNTIIRIKNQNYVDEYHRRLITTPPVSRQASYTSTLNRLPSPHPSRLLKLHTPPQRLLRLPLHFRIFIRSSKPKPRLTVIPPTPKLRQPIQQAVCAVPRR